MVFYDGGLAACGNMQRRTPRYQQRRNAHQTLAPILDALLNGEVLSPEQKDALAKVYALLREDKHQNAKFRQKVLFANTIFKLQGIHAFIQRKNGDLSKLLLLEDQRENLAQAKTLVWEKRLPEHMTEQLEDLLDEIDELKYVHRKVHAVEGEEVPSCYRGFDGHDGCSYGKCVEDVCRLCGGHRCTNNPHSFHYDWCP